MVMWGQEKEEGIEMKKALQKGLKKLMGVKDTFMLLIVVMISQMHNNAQTYQIVYFPI